MTIEQLYAGMDPQEFYIGKVTQVYRSSCIAQIDNLTLMSDRSRFNKSFLPNTINYFVIVDSYSQRIYRFACFLYFPAAYFATLLLQ